MESVSRNFLIFLALIVSINLFGHSRQAIFNSPKLGDFSLFEENGKVGLKDKQGQVLIPAQYEAMGWSNGEFSMVNNVTGYQNNGLWGLINIQNNRVTKAEFVDLSPGEGTLIVARKKIPGSVRIQTGCINTSGKEVIPFQYDGLRVSAFRAIVYTRSGSLFKHGLIDFENKVLIPLSYQNIYPLGSLRYGVENFESKTAIFSEDGKQITNFLIDSIASFKKNYAIIYQKQRQGLIDRQGSIRLEPTYREIVIDEDGAVRARQADSWLFLDGENKMIRQLNADSVMPVSEDLFKIKIEGKFQLTDKDFKAVGHQLFTSIGTFKKGKSSFKNGGKTGIINHKGEVVIKPIYNELHTDKNFIRASQISENKTRWSLLDTTGNVLSFRNYDYIGPFNEKFFPVRNHGYWGALSTEGKEIVACVHDSIVQQQNGLIIVKFKGKYGIINFREEWIVTPQTNKLQLLNEDRYFELTPRTKFLKSLQGQIIYFSDNRLEAKNDHLLEYTHTGSIWKIDLNGVIVDRSIQPENLEKVFDESEGLRAIKKDNRYGFIDSRGRLRIANRYEYVKDFHGTLAAVKIRGRWGFINHADQIAIQPVYDDVLSFIDDFSLVKRKDLFGIIDIDGKIILPVRYDSIIVLDDKRFQVNQNGLWGLADSQGKMLINPKYDQLTDLNNGYVIVSRDKKFGLLTLQGVSTIPQIYDGLVFDPFHNQFIAMKKMEWEVVKF
jgi:hypothetical protein